MRGSSSGALRGTSGIAAERCLAWPHAGAAPTAPQRIKPSKYTALILGRTPFCEPQRRALRGSLRMKFQGTDRYIATPDLMLAVNAALTLKRPLLVKGEPGTGKTMLAEEVAQALGMPLLQWHVKSTTKAQQG
ncbi:MAG: AAA family ATPase, partial [Rubrivivax sp.]